MSISVVGWSQFRYSHPMHFCIVFCLMLSLDLVYGTQKPEDFELRVLSGEPNYKSVNLTWEIESNDTNTESVNSPKVFTIFYCEIQSFGPHRCRSKNVEDNSINESEHIKQYSILIDNLRMATKYSFHIKPQAKWKSQKVSGRSDSRDNEIEPESLFNGQTIIIPTKGFSAEATKCLPHASEIEVETGPYFGGKIVVDGGNCGIQGNPKSSQDKYVMRIDHIKCGSLVKQEANTVETFITVQENLGIFTHSTRRFVVVCTYQSGMQTVRASFTVPGKGSASSLPSTQPEESERSGRERQFRMVDKSSLILKEHDEDIKEKISSMDDDIENAVGILEDIIPGVNEEDIKSLEIPIDNLRKGIDVEDNPEINFAKLIDGTYMVNEGAEPRANSNHSSLGLMIATALSVIMIGVFIYILQREFRRQKTFSGRLRREQITNA